MKFAIGCIVTLICYLELTLGDTTCLRKGSYFLPHSSDCNKFYQCHNMIAHEQNCSIGLHFDKDLSVCTYPNLAGCVLKEEIKEATVEMKCPKLSENKWATFHRHPKHCEKYFMCDALGNSFEMNCPNGLQFDTTLNVCNWPYAVNCQDEDLTTESGITNLPTF